MQTTTFHDVTSVEVTTKIVDGRNGDFTVTDYTFVCANGYRHTVQAFHASEAEKAAIKQNELRKARQLLRDNGWKVEAA